MPTVTVTGYKDFETSQWYGIMAPKGTVPKIVTKLNAEINKALASSAAPERLRILFVCAGNICRSPAAEVVFRYEALLARITRRLEIDSAGTLPWYAGSPPDYRAIEHARRRGYDLSPLRARQVGAQDFDRFDWILAMDRRVLADLEDQRPAAFAGQLGLFLELAGSADEVEVPDPYDQGAAAFERMLDLVEKGSRLLVRRIAKSQGSAA